MNTIEDIKNINIKEVLNKLGVKYNTKNMIYYDGKFKDSYIISNKNNIVTIFNPSLEWLPHGNPFNFYLTSTGATIPEAIEWFNNNFNIHIEKEEWKPIESVYKVQDEDRLASYLFLRGINLKLLPEDTVTLTKAKTYGKDAPEGETYCLSIQMKDINGTTTGYQYRSLIKKGFFTNGNDGMFYNFTKDLKRDYIILVEGASDYLTLRQWTEQVIGFKSASAKPSEEVVAFLNKFNKIYLLFDNDSAGKKCKEEFKAEIDSDIYEIDPEEDINELGKQLGESLLESILDGSDRTKEKVFALIGFDEGLNRGYDELKSRTEASVMSYGFEKFDRNLGYLLPGQLIVVGGVTGVGKSTLVNQIANNVARQGFGVARMSLEDRLEENRINDIYYQLVAIRKKAGDRYPDHSKFEANLFNDTEYPGINVDIQTAVRNLNNFNKGIIDLAHKQMVGIKELENLFKDVVINKGVKLVIIDHLHYVKFGNNQRHDLAIEDFMHQLNDLLRNYKVSCILVSHYKKLDKDDEPDNNSFKDGAAIAQVANKVIHIDKDRNEIEDSLPEGEGRAIRYIVTKNRGKSWLGVISGIFNNGRIILGESTLSKKRRVQKKTGW